MKKIFVAAFGAETNSFSSMKTTVSHFEEICLVRPGEDQDSTIANDGHSEFIRLAKERGYQTVIGTLAYATPSGPLTQETYTLLRDEIVTQVKEALPLDVILLNLHGAMIADGFDDCEGDLCKTIRKVAGVDVIIGGLLDPHAHLSDSMIEHASLLVAYKEYPHTDFAESARKLFLLTERAARGEIKPVMACCDCHSLGIFPTPAAPMREFVDQYLLGEAPPGIADCSLIHSFPWGDSPDAGVKVLVTADNDRKKAAYHARKVGQEFRRIRESASQKMMSVNAAMDSILQSTNKPVIIADSADNPGGGASGDATYLLEEVLQHKTLKAVFGFFWDPVATEAAFRAGAGSRVTINLGGKVSDFSGKPLIMDVDVLSVSSNAEQYFGHGDDKRILPIGKCAAVRFKGVDIIITAKRHQIVSPAIFDHFGLELPQYDVIVLKSSNHFQAAFQTVSSKILYVMTPGVMSLDFKSLPFRKLPRPIWPLDVV